MQARLPRRKTAMIARQFLFAIAFSISAMSQTASLSTSALNFGNQTLGTTSTVQTVTVTNNGTATLKFNGIGLYGVESADWAPLSNTCSGGVLAGHSCTVSAKFTPQAAGARSATIKLTDNAPNSPQPVALTGTGISPVVSFSVPNISFGVQAVNVSSAPQQVTLTNSGTGTLNISKIAASGDYAQTNNCSKSIAPNGSCTINVTFTPTAAWARTGTITVTSNTIGPPLFLSGMGSSGGNVTLSAQSLTFPTESHRQLQRAAEHYADEHRECPSPHHRDLCDRRLHGHQHLRNHLEYRRELQDQRHLHAYVEWKPKRRRNSELRGPAGSGCNPSLGNWPGADHHGCDQPKTVLAHAYADRTISCHHRRSFEHECDLVSR